MPAVLVDAGPLVALLDRNDPHHAACVRTLRTLRDPLVTVWPALTEAAHLVGTDVRATAALFGWITTGAVDLAPLDARDVPRITELMAKYADLPMDLADAALVRVAERDRIRRVFTIDRRDFSVYRAQRIGRLTLVA